MSATVLSVRQRAIRGNRKATPDLCRLLKAMPSKAISNTNSGLTVRTGPNLDRKSTRLNSSHVKISYAVFCLKYLSNHTLQHLSLHDALPISMNHFFDFFNIIDVRNRFVRSPTCYSREP